MGGEDKKWGHVRWISGFFAAVARLVVVGARTPTQTRYNETAQPDGWRDDQLATCLWVDRRMELLAQELRESREESKETNRLLTNLLLGLRASGMADATLGDVPPGFHSVGEV